MGSWIYIIAVIIFAIVSNANKAGKNKTTKPQRGMPSFGGQGERPLRNEAPASREENYPGGRAYSQQEEEERGELPVFMTSAEYSGPDYETGEGLSLEQEEDRDGVKARTEQMNRELERIHRSLDEISNMGTASASAARSRPAEEAKRRPVAPPSRSGLREGLIWAEILGPPRSRQPHATSRKN